MKIFDLDKSNFGTGLKIKSCDIKKIEFSKSIRHRNVLRNAIITSVTSVVFHDGTLPIHRDQYHTYSVYQHTQLHNSRKLGNMFRLIFKTLIRY